MMILKPLFWYRLSLYIIINITSLFLFSRKERNPDLAMPSTYAERCCVSASWWWTATCSIDLEMLMPSRCVKQQSRQSFKCIIVYI